MALQLCRKCRLELAADRPLRGPHEGLLLPPGPNVRRVTSRALAPGCRRELHLRLRSDRVQGPGGAQDEAERRDRERPPCHGRHHGPQMWLPSAAYDSELGATMPFKYWDPLGPAKAPSDDKDFRRSASAGRATGPRRPASSSLTCPTASLRSPRCQRRAGRRLASSWTPAVLNS